MIKAGSLKPTNIDIPKLNKKNDTDVTSKSNLFKNKHEKGDIGPKLDLLAR